MDMKRAPDKICRVGGREFLIYREYDNISEKDILIYPDFGANPECTGEGQPFTLSTEEVCAHFAAKAPEDELYRECGVCKWFDSGEMPPGIIGVCMCEALKQNDANMREESK